MPDAKTNSGAPRRGVLQLETFTESKNFVDNPRYIAQRQTSLSKLDVQSIDSPIIDIIEGFAKLPYCFTLQSCYGHFITRGQRDRYNITRLSISAGVSMVDYRIAYLALCLEGSKNGKMLFQDLTKIPTIEPKYIQFGCAEWFWQRQVNSYVLQVEPIRHLGKDKVHVAYQEAFHIQDTRDRFFDRLKKLLQERLDGQ